LLSIKIDKEKGIAVLEPQGALSQEDFKKASGLIDPYIEKSKRLNGLIIRAKTFPGWDSFGALSAHLKFVRDHHKKITRLAVCTDSAVGNLAKVIAPHFISAEIRVFPYDEFDSAKAWIFRG
jgi:hypothetical protein